MRLLLLLLLLLLGQARKRRRMNEVRIFNLLGRNMKLRCQSVLTDLRDQWLEPGELFLFYFCDFDRGNWHFWCDAYALGNFDETFDVFGENAPKRSNLSWEIRHDGLYLEGDDEKIASWFSYAHLASSRLRV